jgi:hypothetical protein
MRCIELIVDHSISHTVHSNHISCSELSLRAFLWSAGIGARHKRQNTIKSTSFLHQMLALCKHDCNSTRACSTAQLDRRMLADRSPLEAWLAGLHIIHVRCIEVVVSLFNTVTAMSLQFAPSRFTHWKNGGILNVHKTQMKLLCKVDQTLPP